MAQLQAEMTVKVNPEMSEKGMELIRRLIREEIFKIHADRRTSYDITPLMQPKINKWRRYHFRTKSIDDPRPVLFNAHYPWWCTGTGEDLAAIVAYLPEGDDLCEYWPDAFDLDSIIVDELTFDERFPKPDWFKETAS